jgi:putative heme-binding domain-containing protein
MVDSASALIGKPGAGEELRNAAIRLVGLSPALGSIPAGALKGLANLLNIRNSLQLQELAVDSLARFPSLKVPKLLLGSWKEQAPSIRSRILTLILRREEWIAALLDAIQSGLIATGEVGALERAGLTSHPNAAIRKREKALLGATDTNRAAVIRKYQAVKTLAPDPARGFAVFEKYCTPCHRLADTGHPLGPDLAALVDKSTDALLAALLNPNASVERKYSQYTAVTDDGRVTTGIISEETGTSVTILAKEGKRAVFLRNRLARLESSGKSMMPEGLEKDLNPQAVADLISALQEQYPAPKKFPGNTPRRVQPDAAGKLVLSSADCSIYGKSLVLEQRYGNLGMWRGEDDLAVWQVEIPSAGEYQVSIEWACDRGTAGNHAQVSTRDEKLRFKVESTGTWDQYKTAKIGRIRLQAGIQRIRLHPAGPVSQFLIDLRKMTLSPLPR